MIQPVVRRVASSSSTMKHDAEDDVELGRRGGAVGEIVAALDGVDQDRGADQRRSTTSHQRMRLRNRVAIGNSRKLSTSTKATCA